jgi:hypothetical protein
MGETTAWEFDPVLEKLAQDPEEKVRSMAERSRKKLEPPPAPAAPEATASPDAASTPETAPAPEAAPAAPETAS